MRVAAFRRHPDFTRLWVGQALSRLGTRGSALAVPLLVLQTTGSVAEAGVVAFVSAAADVAVTLPGGTFADRHDRRTVMIWCDALSALVAAGFAAAVLTGHATLPVILLACVLSSTLAAVFASAGAAAVPALVGPDDLTDAVSLVQARNAAVHLIGPVLGGALFAIHPGVPFVLDAASFAVSMVLVLGIRTPLGSGTPDAPFRADLLAGLRFVAGHPALRNVLTNAAVLNALLGGVALAVLVSVDATGASSTTVGAVMATSSLGAVVGALAAPSLSRRFGVSSALLGLLGSLGLLVPAMAISQQPWAMAPLLAASALLAPALNTLFFSLLARVTPNHLQGRVNSAVVFAALCLQPLGPLAAGLGLAHLGAGPTFLIAGAAILVLTGWTYLRRADLQVEAAVARLRRGRHRAQVRPRMPRPSRGRHRLRPATRSVAAELVQHRGAEPVAVPN